MVDGRQLAPVDYGYAGSAGNTPRPIAQNATSKPKGLEWEYQTRCSEPGDSVLVDNRASAAPGR